VDAVARPISSSDGAARVFTGRTATYTGPEEIATGIAGFAFRRGVPASVSDATAARLVGRDDFLLTPPTYNVRSSGCC
jgi:hypothetical protein